MASITGSLHVLQCPAIGGCSPGRCCPLIFPRFAWTVGDRTTASRFSPAFNSAAHLHDIEAADQNPALSIAGVAVPGRFLPIVHSSSHRKIDQISTSDAGSGVSKIGRNSSASGRNSSPHLDRKLKTAVLRIRSRFRSEMRLRRNSWRTRGKPSSEIREDSGVGIHDSEARKKDIQAREVVIEETEDSTASFTPNIDNSDGLSDDLAAPRVHSIEGAPPNQNPIHVSESDSANLAVRKTLPNPRLDPDADEYRTTENETLSGSRSDQSESGVVGDTDPDFLLVKMVLCDSLQSQGLNVEAAEEIANGAPANLKTLLAKAKEEEEGEVLLGRLGKGRRGVGVEGGGGGIGLRERLEGMVRRDGRAGVLALLESRGVRNGDWARVARAVEGQRVKDVVEKVQFFANIISGTQAEGEEAMCLWPPVSATLEKFLRNFQVDFSNDFAMRQTIEALQRLSALRNGLRELDDPSLALPRILEAHPTLLSASLEGQLQPAVDRLRDGWGVGRGAELAKLFLWLPPVLLMEGEMNLGLKKKRLKEVGIRSRYFGPMTVRFPWLLSDSVMTNLTAVVDFLVDVDVPPSNMHKILSRCPNLLGMSPENSLWPVCDQLQVLGLSREHLGKVLYACPALLTSRPPRIAEIAAYLVHVGVPPLQLSHILTRCPEAFCSDSLQTLERKMDFLGRVGVVGPTWVGRVVSSFPEMLSMKVGSMEKRLTFLLTQGLTSKDISSMVVKFPPLLGYNVETVLIPKLEFLVHTMGYNVRDVVSCPTYFSYAIKGRPYRRSTILRRRGVRCGLKEMLDCSDEEFALRYMGMGSMLVSTSEP